ncbi:hypothetical protein C3F09_02430 [candidate division GN15 bacterium]|uniref:BPL/LPL catalytic domain-containing protein n=1 Tax=candidate division GN15 bacterium TaxID=2072418 RepID=A0A855X3P3_9BACT|nr:MAG: hypothetical protein C3F09_02430 [candidate division GN15 bacterium]
MSLSHVARCFITHGGEPHFNMAFDEWLFEQALHDASFVAMRMYSWRPGGITIGLNQRAETALNWQAVGETAVIRRVTGGRALYHDPSELTYAVILGADVTRKLSAGGSTQKVSAVLADGLADFLARQGIGAEFVRRSSPLDRRPVAGQTAPCFASSARYELVSDGRKVVASAQRHIGETILQHGSIKTHGVVPHSALPGIGDTSGSLFDGQSIDYEHVKSAARDFFRAIGETIGVEWQVSEERVESAVSLRQSQIMSAPLDRREFH